MCVRILFLSKYIYSLYAMQYDVMTICSYKYTLTNNGIL